MAVTTVLTYYYLYVSTLMSQETHIVTCNRPETSNRTLAEINEIYLDGVPKRHWKGYRTSVIEMVNMQRTVVDIKSVI